MMPKRARRIEIEQNANGRLSGHVKYVRLPLPGPRTLFVIGLAVILGMGVAAWATFYSSLTPVTHAVATGTMTLTAGATGGPSNRFNVSVTDMAAGDTIERTLDLTIGGTITTKELDLLLTASPSTALDANASGLTILWQKCANSWTEGAWPPYTSTCGAGATTVLATETVFAQKARNTFALIGSNPTGLYHLKMTLTLPGAADYATFGNLSTTLSFAFSGPQRDATSK